MVLSSPLIHEIFDRLRSPHSRSTSVTEIHWPEREGRRFVHLAEIATTLSGMDRRLLDFPLEDLLRQLAVPVLMVFNRPQKLNSDFATLSAVYEIDAVAAMIFFECLGFSVSAQAAVARVRPSVVRLAEVTLAENAVYWYQTTRNKTFLRLTTSSPQPVESRSDAIEFRTPTRCQVSAELIAGSVQSINIKAANWRPQPIQAMLHCELCGFDRQRGDADASKAHRAFHARWEKLYEPAPTPSLVVLSEPGQGMVFVQSTSDFWLHRHMYERALEFKREMRFDSTQWERPVRNVREQLREGVLFTRPDGSIDGAAAFRMPAQNGGEDAAWELDWIWIRPGARRQGLLSARWPVFLSRYGEFRISRPWSNAMATYVAAQGRAHQQNGLPIQPL